MKNTGPATNLKNVIICKETNRAVLSFIAHQLARFGSIGKRETEAVKEFMIQDAGMHQTRGDFKHGGGRATLEG